MRLLLAVLLGLAVAGCAGLRLGSPLPVETGDRRTEGGDNARTNATAEVLALPLELGWKLNAEGGFGPAAPLTAGGLAVLATRSGQVQVVSLDERRIRGSMAFGEALEGAGVLDEALLMVPLAKGRRVGVIGFDLVRGTTRWRLRAEPHGASLLLHRPSSTLVAASYEGRLRGLDPETGAVRWTRRPDSLARYDAAPVQVADDAVVACGHRGVCTAFDAATGRQRWSRTLSAPVHFTPAYAAGRLFVATTRGRMLALDAATGQPLWQYQAATDRVRLAAPAVGAAGVVVGGTDGVLRALDPATGAERWTYTTDGALVAAPLLTDALVVFGAMDRRLVALDAATGAVRWETQLEGRIKSAPTLHHGRLLVLAEPRTLYVFAPPEPVQTP